MPRVTTGTVTVTISNLQNTRFHWYSPVLEFKAIASFRHISVDCPLFTGIGVTITNSQNACLLFLQLIWGGFGFRMTDTQGILSSVFQDSPFGFGHLIGTFFIPSETWLVGDALLASHARSGTATPARDSLVCHVARCATVCLTLQQCDTLPVSHCTCLSCGRGCQGQRCSPPSQSAPLACPLLKPGAAAHQKTRLE